MSSTGQWLIFSLIVLGGSHVLSDSVRRLVEGRLEYLMRVTTRRFEEFSEEPVEEAQPCGLGKRSSLFQNLSDDSARTADEDAIRQVNQIAFGLYAEARLADGLPGRQPPPGVAGRQDSRSALEPFSGIPSSTLVKWFLPNWPDGTHFLSDRQPVQGDGHLTNLPIW